MRKNRVNAEWLSAEQLEPDISGVPTNLFTSTIGQRRREKAVF